MVEKSKLTIYSTNSISDIRVPLLVRGPGVQANTEINDVVVNIDLAPTIVEMGGGRLIDVDGVSFLPSLLGKKKISQFVESNDIYEQQKGKYFLVFFNSFHLISY